MAEKQVRVMLLCCPRSTSTLFVRSMSEVPGSQIFSDPYFCCGMAASNLEQLGKSVDDEDLQVEDWLKAAEMIMGEECNVSNTDINKMK